MLLRKSLLVSLPVLALTACGTSKEEGGEKNAAASAFYGKGEVTPPTTNPETPDTGNPHTPIDPNIDPPGESKPGQPTGDQNQNQNQPSNGCGVLTFDKSGIPVQDMHGDIVTLHAFDLDKNSLLPELKPTHTGNGVVTPTGSGYLILSFKKALTISSIDFKNVENNTSSLDLWSESVFKSKIMIPQRAKDEQFTLHINGASVMDKLEIKLSGSTTVDNIKYCVKK